MINFTVTRLLNVEVILFSDRFRWFFSKQQVQRSSQECLSARDCRSFSTTGELGLVAAKSVFGGSWEKVQLASFSPQLAITEGSPLCRIVGYQLCLPQSPQLFGLVTKGALREEV